jgi:hypothetical protein
MNMWRKEFGEAYAVPDVIDQHPQLLDVSWHNDMSPSFQPRGLEDHEEITLRLWVQHPDPAMRESGDDGGRFLVGLDSDDGDPVRWQGDDPNEAITALLKTYRGWRKANPTKKTRAAEARRIAQRAAEDAAEDAAQAAHAAEYPDGCPERCGPCIARVAFGLVVGREFIYTSKHPWSGPERRGTETVTMRCRITHARRNTFDYVALQVLDVADPLPGGAYDGDAWRTRPLTGHQGGMTWSYAATLITQLEMRIVND